MGLEIGFGSWPKWMLFLGKQFMKGLERDLVIWARRVTSEAAKLCEELEQAKAELMKAAKALETAKERSGKSRREKATRSRRARGGRGKGASRNGRKGR